MLFGKVNVPAVKKKNLLLPNVAAPAEWVASLRKFLFCAAQALKWGTLKLPIHRGPVWGKENGEGNADWPT